MSLVHTNFYSSLISKTELSLWPRTPYFLRYFQFHDFLSMSQHESRNRYTATKQLRLGVSERICLQSEGFRRHIPAARSGSTLRAQSPGSVVFLGPRPLNPIHPRRD